MKRIARLTPLLGILAVIATGSLAGASTAAVATPTGLHGFMLRASEATSTFHQTPSFAWRPSAGAVRYELQISQSPTFQENGIFYDNKRLLTPVAAPDFALPWITGNPHSLYARVRAIRAGGGTSPWSANYGFDVVPPAPPVKTVSSYNGLLRWVPVQGAMGYEVWLKDAKKIEYVTTNVFDLREYYTASWPGDVHWRVRAIRLNVVPRLNDMPISTHGAWSPVFTSTMTYPTVAPIQLVGTVSESFSDGSMSSNAHKLTPGYLWTGNEALDGTPVSLFRVEVFTDSACLNRVWTGAAVSSPAYAPRVYGAHDGTALGPNFTLDGDPLEPNENLEAAKPTLTVPGTKDKIEISDGADLGAPIDLWDQDWPSSGYYWTVMPVAETGDGFIDMELAEDVCAAGRVKRFGISSAPALTGGKGSIFASGLSAGGHLVSGAHTAKFYGQPLVAWTPAVNATAYQLQWSRKAYPFKPIGTHLTLATAQVLELRPGTWYYRVRGLDYNLPTGVQKMSWTSPTKIVVAAPRFSVK